MNQKPAITILLLLSVANWAGCAATETGNPITGQQLGLAAVSSAAEIQIGPNTSASHLHVQQAWVVLGDVRFVSSTTCDNDAQQQIDIPGPSVVDLLATPEPLTFAVEAQTYCRVRVPLERAKNVPVGAPAALNDHTILLIASLENGTPVRIRSRDKREAEIRSRQNPFRLDDAESGLLLVFDIGRWLEGIELDGAEQTGSGEILIDDDHNRELLKQFESNTRESLELFRDLNEDGRLNDDEWTVPLASGG